jgi:thiosulfate/3-mercaptopyruvate sulfurtransferase
MVARLNRPDVQIVDARTPKEFSGEDIRAIRGGHIPGAVTFLTSKTGSTLKPPQARAQAGRRQCGHVAQTSRGFEKTLRRPRSRQGNHRLLPERRRASETAGVLQQLGFKNVRVYDSSWLGYGNTLDAPANK